MNDLYIIRHGQSQGNVDSRVYLTTPDWKIELTEKGKQQAKDAIPKLNEYLKDYDSIALYYSSFIRAKQTALIIKEGINNRIKRECEEPLIVEQCCGMLDSYETARENHQMMKKREEYSKFFYRPKDGETGLDVYMRARMFLEDLHRRNDKTVVMVSHGAFIEFFLMYMLGWSVEKVHSVYRPNNCDILHVTHNKFHYELKTPLEKNKHWDGIYCDIVGEKFKD